MSAFFLQALLPPALRYQSVPNNTMDMLSDSVPLLSPIILASREVYIHPACDFQSLRSRRLPFQ